MTNIQPTESDRKKAEDRESVENLVYGLIYSACDECSKTDYWKNHGEILAAEIAELFDNRLEQSLAEARQEDYERGRKDESEALQADLEASNPMGVSQWRELGKRFGYWEYFAEKLRQEGREETLVGLKAKIIGYSILHEAKIDGVFNGDSWEISKKGLNEIFDTSSVAGKGEV